METAHTSRVDHPSVSGFFAWVSERNNIYYRKEIAEDRPPWTTDELLQEYHWCCVHRELDRGSQIYHETVAPEFSKPEDLLPVTFIYRLLNNPDTYRKISHIVTGADTNFTHLVDELESIDGTVFSATYRRNGPRDGYSGLIEQLFYGMIRDQLMEDLDRYVEGVFHGSGLQNAHDTLTDLTGVGDFLANIIVMDLNHSFLGYSENSYLYVGPGASGALDYIFPERNGSDNGYVRWFKDIQNEYIPEETWCPEHKNQLTLHDIQHSLCEYESYCRVLDGGSHRTYDGGTPQLSDF